MILTPPADTPCTIPDDEPTVAVAILELLQAPPAVASVKVIFAPTHTEVGPVIVAIPPVTENRATALAEPQEFVTV